MAYSKSHHLNNTPLDGSVDSTLGVTDVQLNSYRHGGLRPGTNSSQPDQRRKGCRRGYWKCCISCFRYCFCVDCCQELWHHGTCCGLPWWVVPATYLALLGFMSLCIGYAVITSMRPLNLDLSQCPSRVSPQQEPLFTTYSYYDQFNFTKWNESRVWSDEKLCSEGFQGNSDAYGLGVRIGLYLQWASCALANQTLPETRLLLSQSYMIFSLAISIAIFVMTFQNQCVFAIEIVIMYTMFFGGFLSVFYMPNFTKKGEPRKWLGMTWTRMTIFTSYVLMVGHGSWFWTYGYDKHFVNMPCGTTVFFFVPVSSYDFQFWRVILGVMTFSSAVEFAIFYPLFIILFPAELKRSIVESAIYQGLFPRGRYTQIEHETEQVQDSATIRIWAKLGAWYQKLRHRLRFLRMGMFQEAPVLDGRASLYVPLLCTDDNLSDLLASISFSPGRSALRHLSGR